MRMYTKDGMMKPILKLVVVAVLACTFLPGRPCCLAAESRSIGLVPLAVIGEGAAPRIGPRTDALIVERLAAEGASVTVMETQRDISTLSPDARQNLGLEAGVDYLLWGTLFVSGDTISLDVKLKDVIAGSSPVLFFSEARGIENLFSAVNQLVSRVSGEVFRRELVQSLYVEGQVRIEADAILKKVDTRTGSVFSPGQLRRDLKAIYKMGYFEDVRVEKRPVDGGVDIVYVVREKPSVRKVKFDGNRIYTDEELFEVVTTGTGSILNIYKLKADVAAIRSLYTEKNYHNSEIAYETRTLENNQADVVFTVKEGDKVRIETLVIQGNTFFPDKVLFKEIKTRERGFWSWLTSSGDLDRNELAQDVYRLESYYKNNGFIDARVSDPVVDIQPEGITVTFKVQEGEQFLVGEVTFKGDMVFPEDRLRQAVTLEKGRLYSRETLRKNVLALSDLYADQGFAHADIVPTITRDPDGKTVDVVLNITKGEPVFFDRIRISGNSKTRDKVIRRQLTVHEQERYALSKIQRSVANLRRIDYFENVEINTTPGSSENQVDLNVDITEKATGAFSFGGGYSSEDKLFGMISVSERNFMGKGQVASLKAEISGSSTKYTFSFTEPWLFDIPLSAGIDIYNWEREYDNYDKDSKGGAFRLGYKIFDYTRVGFKYEYEDFTIENVDEDYTDVDPGNYVTSSITPSITWDSRNAAFNPTRGSRHSLSVEYAGEWLGGEIEFTKYLAETGWYYPLFWKFTGFLHARAGFLDDRSDEDIDIDYERFYLGGISTVRGYDWQDINASPEGETEEHGGEKMIQLNAEVTFPIIEEMKLVGVVFFDAGDVYLKDEDVRFEDLYTSTGGGFRWYSPMGPIRIEYGRILNGNEYSGGRWEFSVGGTF